MLFLSKNVTKNDFMRIFAILRQKVEQRYRRARRIEIKCLRKKKENSEQQRRRTAKKISVTIKMIPPTNTFYCLADCHIVHREQDEAKQFEVKLFFNETAPVCLPRKLRTFARELFLRSSCLVPHLITWHHDYMGTNATAGDRKDHRRTLKLQTVFRDAFYSTQARYRLHTEYQFYINNFQVIKKKVHF